MPFRQARNSEVTPPVLRSIVLAAVLALLITVDEDLHGTVAVALPTAHVDPLGLFHVVHKGASHALHESIIEVKAEFLKQVLDGLQGGMLDVVLDLQAGIAETLGGLHAVAVTQQLGSRCRLVFIRVQGTENDFPDLDGTVGV